MNGLQRAIEDAVTMVAFWRTRWAVIRRHNADHYEVVLRDRVKYLADRVIVVVVYAPTKQGVTQEPPARVMGRAVA